MPFLHKSPPSSTTTATTASNQTSPKGVKRIVSGLKRRISHISLRGHRRSVSEEEEDARISPFILDVVPDDLPIPLSPHLHSVDTLTRSISAGGLGKHYSDSEDSSSSSSSHTRSSSTDSEHRPEAEHQVESSSQPSSHGRIPSLQEDQCSVGESSTRRAPPELLTAPLEDSSPRRFIASLESLTPPLETLLLAELEHTSSFSNCTEEARYPWKILLPALEPWEIPLPPIQPDEVPLPPLEACDIPLPGEQEDDNLELPSVLAVPLSLGILAVTLRFEQGVADSYQTPSPATLQLWDVPLSEEDLVLPFDTEEEFKCESSTPESPRILPMDPLGVYQSELAAGGVEGAVSDELLTSTLDSQLSASMEVPREIPLVSPPAPVGEPEIPNPFIEDPDATSSDESSAASQEGMTHSAEIALAPPATVPTPRSPNFNKPVPTTPVVATAPSDDEDEEDVPELYLPGLTLPTMFLPIPNVRAPLFSSLTWWLSKSAVNYAQPSSVYR